MRSVGHDTQVARHLGKGQGGGDLYRALLARQEVEIVVGEVVIVISVKVEEYPMHITVGSNCQLSVLVLLCSAGVFAGRAVNCPFNMWGFEFLILGTDEGVVVGIG